MYFRYLTGMNKNEYRDVYEIYHLRDNANQIIMPKKFIEKFRRKYQSVQYNRFHGISSELYDQGDFIGTVLDLFIEMVSAMDTIKEQRELLQFSRNYTWCVSRVSKKWMREARPLCDKQFETEFFSFSNQLKNFEHLFSNINHGLNINARPDAVLVDRMKVHPLFASTFLQKYDCVNLQDIVRWCVKAHWARKAFLEARTLEHGASGIIDNSLVVVLAMQAKEGLLDNINDDQVAALFLRHGNTIDKHCQDLKIKYAREQRFDDSISSYVGLVHLTSIEDYWMLCLNNDYKRKMHVMGRDIRNQMKHIDQVLESCA